MCSMKLSIILTVYNKELYLRKAIEALLSQKAPYNDYEILAINDGSTDGSAAILDEYRQRDNRIRIITQSNQGLSMARNNGVDEAKGDYVWFVDADDVISSYAVRLICEAMEASPDVIPIYACTDGVNKTRNCITATVKTGQEVIIDRKYEDCGVFYVLKRTFLKEKGLRFVPGMYHEDAEFTPRMLYEAQSVVVVPHILYTVIRTPGSITNVPNPKRAYDLLAVAESNYALIEKDRLWKSNVGYSLCHHGAGSVTNALHVIVQQNEKEQDRFNKLYSNKKYLTKLFLRSKTSRYFLFGALLLLFPNKCVKVYRMLK